MITSSGRTNTQPSHLALSGRAQTFAAGGRFQSSSGLLETYFENLLAPNIPAFRRATRMEDEELLPPPHGIQPKRNEYVNGFYVGKSNQRL